MTLLVGRKAPDFTSAAVLADGSIQESYNLYEKIKQKYGLLVFYPLDFTFVCPSEIIALHKRMKKFKELGVHVMTVSVDSQFTHAAWRNTPINKGGIGKVDFDMIADVTHRICKEYGVENYDAGVAFRGTFLIDKAGIIRAQMINDLPLGRNIDELVRLIEAWQFFEKNGEVCPAGWQKGKAGIKADSEGIAKYLGDNADDL